MLKPFEAIDLPKNKDPEGVSVVGQVWDEQQKRPNDEAKKRKNHCCHWLASFYQRLLFLLVPVAS